MSNPAKHLRIQFPDGTTHEYTSRAKRLKVVAVVAHDSLAQAAARHDESMALADEFEAEGYRTAAEAADMRAYADRIFSTSQNWTVITEHYDAKGAGPSLERWAKHFGHIAIVDVELLD